MKLNRICQIKPFHADVLDPFYIIHEYRRSYFFKKRNSFYEGRRKQNKLKVKQLAKLIDLQRKSQKQLDYINNFLSFDENSKQDLCQIQQNTQNSRGQIPQAEQKRKKQLLDFFKLEPFTKKSLFQNHFTAFVFREELYIENPAQKNNKN